MASASPDSIQEVDGIARINDRDHGVDLELTAVVRTDDIRGGRSLLQVVSGIALATSQLGALREGARCRLEFDTDAVLVMPEPPTGADVVTSVPYSTVTSLNIGGPGAVTSKTGGGWIGGGFGPTGILAGVAMASVANALTTRRQTTIETMLELSAGPVALIVLNEHETPSALRVHLAPVFDRIEASHRAEATPMAGSTNDRLGQLKQLGELRAAGVLTEAEFAAEKARILAS